jgi:predicted nucleotidyltransferase component of viral defense system
MILPKKEDAKHKTQMYRLLTAILADNLLANSLYFKGGTCASMRGILDRFSVDLDFDLPNTDKREEIRSRLGKCFKTLGLTIKDQSKQHLQFILKYEAPEWQRNTLKLEITDLVSPKNTYESVNLKELNLFCQAQTIETMVANKMYAATARFEKNGNIAGRDFYDLHSFLVQGLSVNRGVVEERTGQKYVVYLQKLVKFVQKQITDELLYQDLNTLLQTSRLKLSIKTLKQELVVLLNDEIKRG